MNNYLKTTALIFITSALILTGCGGDYESSDSYYDSDYEAADYEDYDYEDYEEADNEYSDSDISASGANESESVDESASQQTSDRKLIKTVNLDVETYDFGELTATIESKTEALGGYIESSDISGNEEEQNRYASYTLRIPAEKADSFVSMVESGSNVTSRSENVEDVTLSYVDIKSRKESLQTEYDRLETLLENAETVDDLITLEERLAEVRYEIESIESQLRTYDNKIDYTTVYLTVDEVKVYTEPENKEETYGERLLTALTVTLAWLWKFLENLSIFIIVAIPCLIILGIPVGLVILLVRFIIKKTDSHRATKKVAAGSTKNVTAGNPDSVNSVQSDTENGMENTDLSTTESAPHGGSVKTEQKSTGTRTQYVTGDRYK